MPKLSQPDLTRSIQIQKLFTTEAQRHRGHREKNCFVNHATGVVNKVKLRVLCASVVKYLYVFDCQTIKINIYNRQIVFNLLQNKCISLGDE
jgi:hypothetical protein